LARLVALVERTEKELTDLVEKREKLKTETNKNENVVVEKAEFKVTESEPDVEFELFFDEPKCKKRYRLVLPEGHSVELDLNKFLDFAIPKMEKLIANQLKSWHGVKFYVRVEASFDKPTEDLANDLRGVSSKSAPVLHKDQLGDALNTAKEQTIKQLENMSDMGSGYRLTRCHHMELSILPYSPLKGSSYIKLPKELANKKAIINPQNYDQMCHMWAVLAAIHPAKKDACRITKYKMYTDELDYSGISFPVKVKDNDKFEELNRDIAINIFGYDYEGKCVYPLRISKENNKRTHVVDLLLYADDTRDDGCDDDDDNDKNLHYALITSLNRLLVSQNSKHDGKVYVCRNCLHIYSGDGAAEDRLVKHSELCLGLSTKPQHTAMPTDLVNMFKNKQFCMRAPYVVYADFETINVPVGNENKNC
jgi:hypothetical protein